MSDRSNEGTRNVYDGESGATKQQKLQLCSPSASGDDDDDDAAPRAFCGRDASIKPDRAARALVKFLTPGGRAQSGSVPQSPKPYNGTELSVPNIFGFTVFFSPQSFTVPLAGLRKTEKD